jgi:signal peptidase I
MVIKRVVGLPGDTLTMTAGTLRRNGRELREPYAVHGDPTRSEDPEQRAKMRAWQRGHTVSVDEGSYAPDLQSWGPIVVPPDSFFGLGDNRDASYDSRYYGFIPLRGIIGQPALVYFSLLVDRTGSIAGVRWSRIGQPLHVPIGADAASALLEQLRQSGPQAR